jgi:hypothetical protein
MVPKCLTSPADGGRLSPRHLLSEPRHSKITVCFGTHLVIDPDRRAGRGVSNSDPTRVSAYHLDNVET